MEDHKKLTIGIFFNARREQGGLYQYATSLVDCLARFGRKHAYVLYNATLDSLPVQPQGPDWQVVKLPQCAIKWRMGLEFAWLSLARILGAHLRGWLPDYPQINCQALDLMLYVKPGIHSFLWSYPAVFPIHDLQHCLQPEFPEVSVGGEFNRREYFYRRSVPRARAILTDSDVGREDVIRLYGVDPAHVFALPYLPSIGANEQVNPADLDRVRVTYTLPTNFYFYPATFWQHKNHARVIKALKLLKEQQKPLHLVLAGSFRFEYASLVELAAQLGVSEQVHFLGYVPDKDLPALYRLARALVMPTFFGPTNIPVLEAWGHDCPVISSDIRGIREQVGDAGLLVNPCSEQEIATAMRQMEELPNLRFDLIERGWARIRSWGPQEFSVRLEEILFQTAQK